MTLLVVGFVGLVALIGVGGTVGARYAEADRAATLEAESRAAGPCTLGEEPGGATPAAPRPAPAAARARSARARGGCGRAAGLNRYQPQLPGPPLNGPTTSWVIHPP